MVRWSRWLLVTALTFTVAAPAAMSFESSAIAAQKKRKRRAAKKKAPPPPKREAAPPPPPAAPPSDIVPTTSFSGPTRIDFDDRLIQGQTNKSGAVYLFDRKETGISSMVKRRKSFRHLTIRTVYDR